MKISQILVAFILLPFMLQGQHQISGAVNFPNALPICNVLVELRDGAGLLLAQDLSEEDGTFLLEDIPTGVDYVVEFFKRRQPTEWHIYLRLSPACPADSWY